MANIPIITAPALYVHIENPVKVKVKADVSTALLATIRLIVLRVVCLHNTEEIEYSLSAMPGATGEAEFDLSTALQFCFEAVEQQSIATSNHIFLKEEGYTMSYRIYGTLKTITGDYAPEETLSKDTNNSWNAARAGMSTTVFASGFNVFNNKHFNSKANYFLTSRTAGHTLSVRENEQRVFWFLSKKDESFTFRNIHDQTVKATISNIEFSCFAIDLEQVRQSFYYTYGHLPNIIDIEREGFATITFAITPSAEAIHMRILEFKNAYDVIDKIELTGRFELNHNTEGESYSKYNESISGFYFAKPRANGQLSLKGNIGYKTSSERLWFTDCISSPEIFLLDNGSRLPVIISNDSRPILADSFSPKSIPIDITYSLKDNRYTPVV